MTTALKFRLLPLPVMLALGAAVPARATDAADAVHQAHVAYGAAINSNNVDTFLGMVTDDVVFLSPNEPAVVGKAALSAWAAAYLKAFTIHWDKSVKDLIVTGEWAFERYAYRENDTPRAGGAPLTDTGKGLIVYHRDAAGKWRVARDAWNSDLALPAQ